MRTKHYSIENSGKIKKTTQKMTCDKHGENKLERDNQY